jgi:hypothetical protein
VSRTQGIERTASERTWENRGVTIEHAVLGAVGLLVAWQNAVTTRRVWRSPVFERAQKIAQTVMLWVLPGSFIFSRAALGGGRRPRRVVDTTSEGGGLTALDWSNADAEGGLGHHDGGGFDGGYGHGGGFDGGHH